MKNIFNKTVKNKKYLIITIILIIAFVISAIMFLNKDKEVIINNLKISYDNGDQIKMTSSDKEKNKIITIENTSNELITYSLNLENVKNNLENKSNLLYKISSTGERAASLFETQLPIKDSKIFDSVAILPGKTHIYKIKIINAGEKQKEKFKGTLVIKSEKNKKTSDEEIKEKIEEYKERYK